MKSIEEICTEWANMASMHPIVGEGKTDSEVKLMWDRSASTYSDSMYSEIIGQMIDMLLTKGIISSDRTVLDIGCGIGSFTRPLSRHAKNIISMDSSKTMLSVLERNCEKESISNIHTYERDCTDIPGDIVCDVVFSSLCPPMNSPSAILSMEDHAVEKCVYISSANIGTSIETEIWSELGCDYSYSGYDTRYPYDSLTALGRDAELHYFEL